MEIRLQNDVLTLKGIVLLLLFHLLLPQTSGLCTDYDVTSTALVNILLDETSGPNCDEIQLAAIQEKAAIEYAVHSVNAALKRDGYDMKIQANTFDTCSSIKNVKKVVLKALVTSEQTCPEPPLLLGFIGPQSSHLLNETRKVTNVFSTIHILANNYKEEKYENPPSRNTENEDILYLYDNYVEQKYEIVVTTLKKLNWASFILITDQSEISDNIGRQFLTARHAQQANPCVVGDTLVLPKDKADVYNFYKKLLLELEAGHQDGLVIIVNEMSRELGVFLRKFGTEHPTVLSLNQVGIGAWQVPQNNQFFLLQEVSSQEKVSELGSFINKTAFAQFIKQQEAVMKSTVCINKDDVVCGRMNLAEDLLYTPFASSGLSHLYSLQLLAATLRTLHRLKCKSETSKSRLCSKLVQINKADDLNTSLRRATSMYEKEALRFGMNAEPLVQIYNVDLMDNQLKQVATVHGPHFDLLPNRKLPIKPFPSDSTSHRNPACRHRPNLPAPDSNDIPGARPPPSRPSGDARPPVRGDNNVRLDEDTTVKTIVMSTQTSRPSIWHFIPNVRNIDSSDDYVNIAIVLLSVGSAFFLIMICVICCLWKCFRVKGERGDRDGYDDRSVRSVESGHRVKMARRKQGKGGREVRRNESVRSARSVD